MSDMKKKIIIVLIIIALILLAIAVISNSGTDTGIDLSDRYGMNQ